MNGWMNGWMDGWMGGWVSGCDSSLQLRLCRISSQTMSITVFFCKTEENLFLRVAILCSCLPAFSLPSLCLPAFHLPPCLLCASLPSLCLPAFPLPPCLPASSPPLFRCCPHPHRPRGGGLLSPTRQASAPEPRPLSAGRVEPSLCITVLYLCGV